MEEKNPIENTDLKPNQTFQQEQRQVWIQKN